MRKKLRSSKGMTLTELLVALAIVALIGVSLTVGISSAAKVYRDSTRLYEAETLCGTILTYLEDEFRFGRNIRNEPSTPGSDPKVIFDSQVFGNDVKVIIEDGKVKIGSNSVTPSTSFDLLGEGAYTSGLKVIEEKCKISYDGNKQVTIKIAVGPDDDNIYADHTVKVVPVDN